MEIIFVLIALSLFMSLVSLTAFLWANSKGQFEDLERPAEEILYEKDTLLP